ncbi:DMT family transporter [Aquibium sp. ELW1220]|jgi:drug/metabolite transporter (DMT)-like permease|uniref:DMT family transporter n=1 Tax=Aquibium sp. ELW1220 TaxID=2976766 RepID=UPI0025B23A0A|nr:DMT family transporter [Aquibium sp. ELW1220]MDN2583732.1 DMT family transporter [Aquibium sp. ELW1220]
MTQKTTPAPMTAAVWAQILTLGAIWGGSFFFARIAVAEIPPITLVLLRVGIAAAALHVFLAATGQSFAPALRMAGPLVLLSLFNNVVPFSLIFMGQTELGAGLASVLNATTPFWTALVASAFLADEQLTVNKVAGVLIGIAGTAIMVGPGVLAGLGGPVWAKLFLVGASLSYAFAFILAKRITGLPPQLVAAGQLTASTAVMLPVALLVDGGQGLATASLGAWSAVLGLALLATAFAYILYFRIVAAAGASNASLVTLIVPASAILLGTVFLAERLELFELAGIAIIACGLVVIDGRLLRRRSRDAAVR